MKLFRQIPKLQRSFQPEAIDYLAHWDYGEYHTDPEAVDTIYTRNGRTHRKGEYVMHSYFDGSHALYRIMEKHDMSV